jgi:hypothetical protein
MVMMYSDFYNSATRANCIGSATAPLYAQQFQPTGTRWCSSNNKHGYLDPQIFTDSNGSNYLLFSEQWGCSSTGSGCNSILWIQPLSADDLSWVGSPYQLLTYSQAATIKHNTTRLSVTTTSALLLLSIATAAAAKRGAV